MWWQRTKLDKKYLAFCSEPQMIAVSVVSNKILNAFNPNKLVQCTCLYANCPLVTYVIYVSRWTKTELSNLKMTWDQNEYIRDVYFGSTSNNTKINDILIF